MRAFLPAVVLTVVAAAGLSPANAQSAVSPTYPESRVYFTCKGGPAKVQNTNGHIGWTSERPAGSVYDGAGCAFVDPGPYLDQELDGPDDAFYAGQVVGNVRNLTVEAYITGPTLSQVARNEIDLGVALTVDGSTVYGTAGEADRIELQATGIPDTYKVEFTITNWPWLGLEDGDGTKARPVELHVSPWFFDVATWVWGSSELPGGITFNDETPAQELGLLDEANAAPPQG